MGSKVFFTLLKRICLGVAGSLLIPLAVGLFYGEREWVYYLMTACAALLLSMALGVVASRRPDSRSQITRRDGFLAVVVSWLIIIFLGALPYYFSGAIPGLSDAIFESASGYTTTGATILSDIEALSKAHLFQRSFAHWIGGMGIIVLTVAILPELAVGGLQIFAAEASGIDTDKISPRIADVAGRLWGLYGAMTCVCALLLWFFGMDGFDAVTHAFGTLATGGFSTRNQSIGAYDSLGIEVVIMVFMLAAGASFALQYRMYLRRDFGPVRKSEELRLYGLVFVIFTLAITGTLVVSGDYSTYGEALRYGSFQTAAILTTTGYGTADYDRWPDLCRYLLVLLMFLGGCAGSTAGGVKVIRLLVVFKHGAVELKKLIYPQILQPVVVNGASVAQSTIQGILGFFLLYITTIAVATTVVLALGVDLVTGVSAVISAMNSIGPGLGLVGPASNYAALPDACKWVLAVCMVVGRLEIYTVFVLVTRAFWRY
jgi:trk system potassium uptake protein TrkH